MGKVTLRDVAEDAGVSIATASFAINNCVGRVSKVVRKRVLASADKLGYIPNINARNLRTKVSNTYMLVYDESYLLERNASTLQFVASAIKYSSKREKNLILYTIPRIKDGEKSAADFMHHWNAMHVDGVIFQIGEERSEDTHKFFEIILKNNVNFVIISPNGRLNDFPSVYIDDYELMKEEVAFIYSKGYREIYHITRKTDFKFERERGFVNAMSHIDAVGGCLYYDFVERTQEDLWNMIKDVIENRKGRIAFACWNDVDAIYILKALHDHGISVPNEIGVMGFDDIPATEFMTPPLTTVKQPFDLMASKAIEVLTSYMSVREYNKFRGVKVNGSIVERDSI